MSNKVKHLAPPTRFVVAALAALASGSLLSGCTSLAFDSRELAAEVSRQFEQQVGVMPTNVDCPDGLESKQGASTRCVVTDPDGSQIGVTVSVTELDTGDLQFSFEVDDTPLS